MGVNWLVKPFSMALLGWLFIGWLFRPWLPAGQVDSYIAGLILLAAAPCTTMVFVWSNLLDGEPNFTLSQVALNDLIMVVAFAPIVALLLGLSSIAVPWDTLLLSVVLYIVVPVPGLPLNRLPVPKAPPPMPTASPQEPAPHGAPWTMIVLACVFGATWFISTAFAAHLPRLLEALGATSAAAVAAGALVGPAQVAARAEFTLLRRASPLLSARLATGLHPLGALLLALVGLTDTCFGRPLPNNSPTGRRHQLSTFTQIRSRLAAGC